jgi:hypothetical protein
MLLIHVKADNSETKTSGLNVRSRIVHDFVCVAGEAWDEWDEEKGFIPVIHWSAESALGTRTTRIEEMHRTDRPLLTYVPFWLIMQTWTLVYMKK